MDPTSGKLFGVIGNVDSSEEAPAFFAAADAVIVTWYTRQWLKCQGYDEGSPAQKAATRAEIVTTN